MVFSCFEYQIGMDLEGACSLSIMGTGHFRWMKQVQLFLPNMNTSSTYYVLGELTFPLPLPFYLKQLADKGFSY